MAGPDAGGPKMTPPQEKTFSWLSVNIRRQRWALVANHEPERLPVTSGQTEPAKPSVARIEPKLKHRTVNYEQDDRHSHRADKYPAGLSIHQTVFVRGSKLTVE
jgi:hypothetical protein